ncbi:MAG: FAD:protein FMN transferase [Anaerolineae bacterium]|nr:FAD:protein FMN transferase [Anaerolineae bacterium]
MEPHPDWPSYHFRAMGSAIGVWLDVDDEAGARQAFATVEGLFAEVEAALSRFRPSNELCRLNSRPGEWVPVSRTLWKVLERALDLAEMTGGLFDPTVLSAVRAAGYRDDFETLHYTTRQPADVLRGSWQTVRLDEGRRAVLLPDGIGLDFGGIGKGYTAAWAINLLDVWGPALVDAGGDLVAGRAPRGQAGWPVTVNAPSGRDEPPGGPLAFFWLANHTVATSGVDFRRWQTDAGEAHHIIDPRTGKPVENDIRSASVLAGDATLAEALAKAALIEPGLPLPEGVGILTVTHSGETWLNEIMRGQAAWQKPLDLTEKAGEPE